MTKFGKLTHQQRCELIIRLLHKQALWADVDPMRLQLIEMRATQMLHRHKSYVEHVAT